MAETQVYSYHTFLYPFRWVRKDKEGKEDYSFKPFEEKLKDVGWEPDDLIDQEGRLTSAPEGDKDQQRLDYQIYQYFNPAARAALFRWNGDIVHGWVLKPGDIHNQGEYRIFTKDKDEDNNQKKKYILNINHVRLRLFNTGVGILIFELEYPMPEGEEKQGREDVLKINEYGRRLYPEFLPGDSQAFQYNLCAERIELSFGGQTFSENIRERAESHLIGTDDEDAYLYHPDQSSSFINELLNTGSEITITPAIDDRMFVCCCIVDEKYPLHFLGHDAFPEEFYNEDRQNARWAYLNDWDIGRELYGLINVDASDSSCQNRKMLDKYLEDQLYLRWFEYGTMHAVTNHSMFCISSPAVMNQVIKPFLIQYIQLCILVLAQRASLIAFDARITDAIADGKQEESQERIMELSKKFATFQGQLLMAEVTSQIQGIEVYEKLQKMLFVDKLEENLLRQMKTLFEITQYEQGKQQEEQQENVEVAFNLLGVLAIFSACVDAYDFFEKQFPNLTNTNLGVFQNLLWWIVVIAVVVIGAYAIFNAATGFCKWVIRKWKKRKRGD